MRFNLSNRFIAIYYKTVHNSAIILKFGEKLLKNITVFNYAIACICCKRTYITKK